MALAIKLQQKLPRELRDLIYTFYLASNPIDWYRVLYNTYWNTASFRTWAYLPHFILPEYSGIGIARELGQVAFQVEKFVLYEHVGILQLQHTLTYDHLSLGLVPAECIREIKIVFDSGSLECIDCEEENQKLDRVKENLEALKRVRVLRKFKLELIFEGNTALVAIVYVLHMLLPVYFELKEGGAKIMVIYRRRVKGQSDRVVLDIGAVLEHPKEEWRSRILDLCRAIGPLSPKEISWAQKVWSE